MLESGRKLKVIIGKLAEPGGWVVCKLLEPRLYYPKKISTTDPNGHILVLPEYDNCDKLINSSFSRNFFGNREVKSQGGNRSQLLSVQDVGEEFISFITILNQT